MPALTIRSSACLSGRRSPLMIRRTAWSGRYAARRNVPAVYGTMALDLTRPMARIYDG